MEATTFASKPRYEILDGLRGVAAFLVVIFHFCETYFYPLDNELMSHGYLAVDFFFMLSGFVLGYAYDDRWGQGMSTLDFFKRRLARLHPMLVMGCFIGAATFYLTADGFDGVSGTSIGRLLLCFLVSITIIRVPRSLDIRLYGEVSPLDAPAWSLFYEYVGNILYALLFRRFPKWLLAAFVALMAFLLVDYSMELNLLGLVPEAHIPWGVNGGFEGNIGHIYLGMIRLLFAFLGGLLLYRMRVRIKLTKCPYLLLSFVLAAVIMLPIAGHVGGHLWKNALYECMALFVVFPLLIGAGSGSEIKNSRSLAFCKWMGAVSYPLYITHYSLVYLHMAWYKTHADAPASMHIVLCICLFLLSVFIANACLKAYDEPVRAWLKEHWLTRKK